MNTKMRIVSSVQNSLKVTNNDKRRLIKAIGYNEYNNQDGFNNPRHVNKCIFLGHVCLLLSNVFLFLPLNHTVYGIHSFTERVKGEGLFSFYHKLCLKLERLNLYKKEKLN